MNTFSELGLEPRLVDALNELGIVKPTEIQEKAIPFLIDSMQDFIGLAQTGTGKTAAFGLPLLHVIDEDLKAAQGVVLAPTRELAQQIAEGLKSFSKNIKKIKVEAVYGGAAIVNQIKALKAKPQVIVATPGRLVDLIQRKVISFDALKYVILDEADEMLNMGFKEELNKILEVTPDDKTTWLFSATMPKAIKHIVSSYMNNPLEISVKSGIEVNKNIKHQYLVVKMSDKLETVRRIIDMDPNFYGVMFCKTKIDTQQLAEDISRSGYSAEALHGDLTQKQRDVVMRKFKSKSISLLVATDVAARGIDVNDLTHVLHHRLPDELEYYTHRSGRTARAGKKGISIALVTKGELRKISQVERQLKIEFEKTLIPTSADVQMTRMSNWAQTIVGQEIHAELPEVILTEVKKLMGELSTDDLISKLLSIEWSKIDRSNALDLNSSQSSSRSREDREERRGGRSDRGGRGERSERGGRSERGERSERKGARSSNSSAQRFFINLGKIDDISNAEMLNMICDISKVNKTAVGKIEIQQKRSYFEVDKGESSEIESKFKGYELDGREIRVNKDDELPQRSDRSRSSSGPRKGGSSGSGRQGRGRRFDK